MKKLFVLGLLAGLVGSAGAACMGPFCYDDGGGAAVKSALSLPTCDTSVNPGSANFGKICVDSSYVLYVATGTASTPGKWVKASAQ